MGIAVAAVIAGLILLMWSADRFKGAALLAVYPGYLLYLTRMVTTGLP